MADGKTHEYYGRGALAASFAIASQTTIPLWPFTMGQLIALYIASPDVDTRSNSTRRWGILEFIWTPLQSVTKHRGITHNPIIGPFVVIGYLAAIAVVALHVLTWIVGGQWTISITFSDAAAFMGGVTLQYWVHLFLDFASSQRRRG